MKKVSIIIPYYNRPGKLDRCIESINAQKFKNFEVIVVDDCSELPPNQLETSITYVKNDMNRGPGYCRNVGLQMAKGMYVAFLDCDDYYHEKFLKETVNVLEKNSKISMVYANGRNVNENNETVEIRKKEIPDSKTILPTLLKNGKKWGTGGCVWRMSDIIDVRWIDSRAWEDYAFAIDVAILNNYIEPISDALIFYDISGQDKLSNTNRQLAVLEKNKSILYISNSLWKSHYNPDPYIKESILISLLD